LYFFICGFLFSSEDSIIYLRISDSTTLDPGKYEDIYSGEVISNIFEGLCRFKKGSFEIEPCLAENWEIKDNGKKWIFYLRKGVRFHNGEVCDARSVVYSFLKRKEKAKDEYMGWNTLFGYINDVKAIGRYKIILYLSKPYAPLLTALTDPYSFIVSVDSYNKPDFKPIGTGPFEFEKWKKGDYLILRKNENYWGGEVNLSKIIFKINRYPEAKILQIKNGKADIANVTSAKEHQELIGLRNIKILTSLFLSTHFMAFNMTKKPFSDIRVRKAFSHLINKEALIKNIFQNSAIPATTPLPPVLSGFNHDIKDFSFDLAEARKLLKKAGLESGFTSTLYFSKGNYGAEQIANVFTKNAKLLNINIKKKRLPFTTLLKKSRNGEHDLLIMGWSAGPDPDLFLYSAFTLGYDNLNFTFYEDKILKEILVKARESLEPKKRISLYKQAQEIIHREVFWIPLYHLKNLVAYNLDVKNLYMNPLRCLIFKDTYKKK